MHSHDHGCGGRGRFFFMAGRGGGGFGPFGHGFRGPRGGGRGDGFRPGRLLGDGDLRLIALALIEETPRHGYDIIKALEERSSGAYSPSPGVVYPTLSLLEEMGYATSRSDGGKKLYAATEEGRAALASNQTAVDGIFRRMQDLHEKFDGPGPRIARAMENLGSAISTRMRGGPVSPDQLNAIVDAIDAAARSVETA